MHSVQQDEALYCTFNRDPFSRSHSCLSLGIGKSGRALTSRKRSGSQEAATVSISSIGRQKVSTSRNQCWTAMMQHKIGPYIGPIASSLASVWYQVGGPIGNVSTLAKWLSYIRINASAKQA